MLHIINIIKMEPSFLNPFEAIDNRLQSIEEKISQLKLSPPQQTSAQVEERFLDVKQTAQLFGVSTVSIWQYEKQGLIKSYRLGQNKRFRYSELLQSPKLIQRNKK